MGTVLPLGGTVLWTITGVGNITDDMIFFSLF